MKTRIFLTLFLLFSAVSFSRSQSLEILESSPITIHGTPDETQLELHLSVRNQSTQPLDVRAAIHILEAVPEHLIYFCWTNCYAPGVTESPDVETIAPGETNAKFVTYLRPNGKAGISKVEAIFFVDGNPDDNVSAIAEFQVSSISGVQPRLPAVVSVHPVTQAPTFLQLEYAIPFPFHSATLKIFNVLGKQMRTYLLRTRTGVLLLDRSLLPAGAYFYTLQVDGKVYHAGRIVLP